MRKVSSNSMIVFFVQWQLSPTPAAVAVTPQRWPQRCYAPLFEICVMHQSFDFTIASFSYFIGNLSVWRIYAHSIQEKKVLSSLFPSSERIMKTGFHLSTKSRGWNLESSQCAGVTLWLRMWWDESLLFFGPGERKDQQWEERKKGWKGMQNEMRRERKKAAKEKIKMRKGEK